MRSRLLIVLLAAVALSPGAAQAASVSAEHETEYGSKGGSFQISVLKFAAEAGETNDVTITSDTDGTLHVSDAGAPLTASGLCSSAGPHEATCPSLSDLEGASVALGDGDDSANVTIRKLQYSYWATTVDGGEGNDQVTAGTPASLRGGPGDDMLNGSVTNDKLSAGPGHDVVRGDGGDDEINDDSDLPCGEADEFYGGPGTDRVSYAARTCAVRIDAGDLETPQGSPGEGDRLDSVESFTGGSGDDYMRAAPAGGGSLVGGPGNDRLEGGPGPDGLAGGGGMDIVVGGPGNDMVSGRDGSIVDGGPGDDGVSGDRTAETLIGGEGNDRIDGDSGRDTIKAGPGDDTVDHYSGVYAPPAADLDCGDGMDSVNPGFVDLTLACEQFGTRPGAPIVLGTSRTGLTVTMRCPFPSNGMCTSSVIVRNRAGRVVLARSRARKHWPRTTTTLTLRFKKPVPASTVLRVDVRQRWIEQMTAEPNHDDRASLRVRVSTEAPSAP